MQFGDHDGIGSEVLLQHPLGVLCGKDGQIYIADSYNHKVLTGEFFDSKHLLHIDTIPYLMMFDTLILRQLIINLI